MQCYTNEEALASLFLNLSTSFFLILILLYSAVSLLLNLLHFIGGYPLLHRNEDGYDSAAWSYDEEEEEEEEEEEMEACNMSCNTSYHLISRNQDPDHLIADIGEDGESLVFYNNLDNRQMKEFINVQSTYKHEEEEDDNDQNSNICSTEEHFSSANVSPYRSESSIEDEDGGVEDLHDDRYNVDEEDEEVGGVSQYDVVEDLARKQPNHSSTRGPSRLQSGLVFDDKTYNGREFVFDGGIKKDGEEIQPSQGFGTREIKAEESEEEEERGEIFGESSCTNESTSKSSSDWRNSVKTDDPFSSSSRRSCPNWESYTVFQKYDEEMTFLTQISTQKLNETESLKSIMVEPRSISERIVHKLSSNGLKKKQQQHASNNVSRPNPYVELESAYVAQICLTWEALSWNYKNFERKRSSKQQSFNDIGCPAGIADQFRTFHILLQRYVENEPYEHGRRPEIYARMRTLAPKLLLVPEYQDYEEDEEEEKEDGFKSRISSASFLMIMEECIRTFMNFLKADKEKPCQKLIKAFFGRSKRGSVDPTHVHLIKKVNTKKKMKLKEIGRGGKYMRKKKMSIEEEMEILMGLIDLKVVSRVLRMKDINEEKLHWCEEKMSKVKMIQDGKALQRDSTPLFFPPH